jgi:L-2-hydroxyglutarate oxidase
MRVLEACSKHYKQGVRGTVPLNEQEIVVKSLQKLIPKVAQGDLSVIRSGALAEAMTSDGKLVNPFLFLREVNSSHVCNAPLPAATAALEMGRAPVTNQVPELRTAVTASVPDYAWRPDKT